MAIRITCPSCDFEFKVPETKQGRRVRCPECDKAIHVPDDDDDAPARDEEDDRPRRKKKRRPASKGISIWWFVGGGAAVFVLLLVAVIGVTTYLIVRRGADAIERIAVPKDLDLNRGRTLLNQNSVLSRTDPRDPTIQDANVHMKAFPVTLKAGKSYVIAMNSRAFDTYLRLENPQGKTVVEDDDGGGALNSRIHFNATDEGLYRVIATSFEDNATGPFNLIVQELP